MKGHRILACLVAIVALIGSAAAVAGPKKLPKVVAPTLDKDLANEIFAVLERGTRSADMETRATAVSSIARVRPEVLKDYVVDALKDPQWIVRRASIAALIRIKDPAYRESLGQSIANATLYERKELSPLALVLSLPMEEAIQLLEEALTKVQDVRDLILKEIFKKDSPLAAQFYEGLRKIPAVKQWVMDNLSIFKDPKMYPLLVKTTPELEKGDLLKVFKFLETLDPSYDVSFLKTYLQPPKKGVAPPDEEVVEGAAFILALRGDPQGVEIILPICDENDIHRQLRCLQGIKGLATDPEVKERAKLFLYGDPDPDVLYAVYDIFVTAKDDSIYDRVVQRLQSTNLGHRAASVFFLGRLKGNRALPQLHGLLRDGSSIIRLRAAQAIGELRQAESIPSLADALKHDADEAVKKELVKALGNIGEKAILDTVSFLIFDPTVRDEAIEALCKVRHREAISTLRNVLQTQFTKEQRSAALKAIIQISPAEGFNTFKGCLGWIPEGFLEELAQEVKGEFVPYLAAALESISDRVREEAVLAFRYVGAEAELKVLEREMFASKDVRLRVKILARLAELKGDGALELVSAFFKDDNRDLRLAAIRLAAKYAKADSPAVATLRGMLMDPDEAYRVASAVTLMDIFLVP
ncbi:MAG: HEAT repeat domain-containing protein [Deltaproteobacteria bacterium]|nr:HEAT repeat domain-containing protein [Deltaproteobacteria bacterium]